ncbi:hypothetical protein H9P43_006671 [Blastocladiella emersonii ATCC 22665]|nr:hypothetical protein H9P43_006671 [Blastocladiella emersonii ATCC 22665]
MSSTTLAGAANSGATAAADYPPGGDILQAPLVNPPLSDEEREFMRKHAGHEGTHLAMVLILLASLVGMQVLLIEWRRRRPKSYTYASLAGLAVVPLVLAVNAGFTRFVTIYGLFAVANSWVVYRASRRPISAGTPRAVYRWFSAVYQVCYALGIVGYTLLVLTVLGITNLFFNGPDVFGFSMLLLFYGLYFGVLSRDLVEVLSDHMASGIGYYSKEGLPQKYLRENVCAVCGDHVGRPATGLPTPDTSPEDGDDPNPTYMLNCRHKFHSQCLRGWTIIGKKASCPYCGERVDLAPFQTHPWDRAQAYYLQLVDLLRYMVVFQPMIFLAVQGVYKVFGLE